MAYMEYKAIVTNLVYYRISLYNNDLQRKNVSSLRDLTKNVKFVIFFENSLGLNP